MIIEKYFKLITILLFIGALWPSQVLSEEKAILFALDKGAANVSAFNPKTGQEIYDLKVGEGPHEAATSPDGKWVVVANYGKGSPGNSLSVINVDLAKVTKTISLNDYHQPHGIAYLPDGKRVVVTVEAEKKLLVVDIPKGKILHAIATDQKRSHMVAINPEGSQAYVANIDSGSVSVIDLIQNKLIKIIPTDKGSEGITYVPTTREIWVSNRAADTLSIIDQKTLKVVASLKVPGFPIRAVFVAKKNLVLVTAARGGELFGLDIKQRKIIQRVKMPGLPLKNRAAKDGALGSSFTGSSVPIGILPTPEGGHAYIANSYVDVISKVNLNTWTTELLLKTGREPDGMAWGKK